jgi:hypothetical protein
MLIFFHWGEMMATRDLTADFNNTTSFFGRLFSLFTSPSPAAGTKDNSFSAGIENFLKFIFSTFGSDRTPTPTPSTSHDNNTAQQPQRSFMGTLRDDFSSATSRVTNFFTGAAFDTKKAVSRLWNSCSSLPGGHCLASVENAMTAAGLRFSGGRTITDVMPVRNGTHYAKDLAPVLASDNRFQQVTTGYGANFSSTYTPQVGDIAVWSGSTYGHTQMFAGYDNKGAQVWISDFKTNGSNWTGLANPDSHGQFRIFRQKTEEQMAMSAPRPQAPAPAPALA